MNYVHREHLVNLVDRKRDKHFSVSDCCWRDPDGTWWAVDEIDGTAVYTYEDAARASALGSLAKP